MEDVSRLKRILKQARAAALRFRSAFVGTEHLLFAIAEEEPHLFRDATAVRLKINDYAAATDFDRVFGWSSEAKRLVRSLPDTNPDSLLRSLVQRDGTVGAHICKVLGEPDGAQVPS